MNLGWPLAAAVLLAAVHLRGQAQSFRLPSGLRCVLLETHDQPLIRLELAVRWDQAEAPANVPGLAALLAAAMRAGGAGPYTRAEFNRALDDLGVQFGFENRRDGFTWTLSCDSRSQEPALELLAHAVFRPALEAPLVAAQRQDLARRLAAASPRQQGEERFLWALGDPAREGPQVPAAQDTGDLGALRRRLLGPGAATLVLHGDLSLAQAKELVFLHFGLWGGGPQAAPGPQPVAEPAPRLIKAAEPGEAAELWAGCPAPGLDPAQAELLALLLDQVPEAAGPGLSISCGLTPGGPLVVKVKAAPGHRQELPAALRACLERLRSQGFSAQALDRARLRWRAVQAALPLHPRELVHACLEGRTDPAFPGRVEGLGLKEINATLAGLLAPGALRYLYLGGGPEPELD